jgi:hypothetical protein
MKKNQSTPQEQPDVAQPAPENSKQPEFSEIVAWTNAASLPPPPSNQTLALVPGDSTPNKKRQYSKQSSHPKSTSAGREMVVAIEQFPYQTCSEEEEIDALSGAYTKSVSSSASRTKKVVKTSRRHTRASQKVENDEDEKLSLWAAWSNLLLLGVRHRLRKNKKKASSEEKQERS